MSIFVPFRAFRPRKEFIQEVSTRPYDVLSCEEARSEAGENPNSYYRVIKPEIEFPEGTDPFSPEVYARGKSNLERLIREGVLTQDARESFYVYRLVMGSRTQTGLVGCSSIDDYFSNVIKRHELTKPAIEEDRTRHVEVSEFNYEPVFFCYPGVDEINAIVDEAVAGEPLYDFEAGDGIRHTVWRIDDREATGRITELFATHVPTVYIADGHHRTAAGAIAGDRLRSAARLQGDGEKRYGLLMSVLFPDNEVDILDYNRVVTDLNGLSDREFLEALHSRFDVAEVAAGYRPVAHNEIAMYFGKRWYRLSAHRGTFNEEDLIDRLGFTILSKQLLEPVLGITDLQRDKRIDFVGGIRGLGELERRVNSGEMKVAFAMHPISVSELMEISDNDLIMPPKVTWFEPKLRSGLFAHSLGDRRLKGEPVLQEAKAY